MKEILHCEYCGASFEKRSCGKNKFCSIKCRSIVSHNKANARKVKRFCLNCDTVTTNKYFCSRKCAIEHGPPTEVRKILSETNKGNKHRLGKNKSDEERRKISIALQGNKNGVGNIKTEAGLIKISNTHKGKTITVEQRKQISDTLKRKYASGEITAAAMGKPLTANTKLKLSAALKGRKVWNKGLTKETCPQIAHTQEEKDKISIASKQHWEDDNYVNDVFNGWKESKKKKPNKKEIFMIDLLYDIAPILGCRFEYVGNGLLRIGRKNPDFREIGGNRLIEFFGDYWHRGQNSQERIDYFKKFGYDTLVIWEWELKNKQRVVNKIRNFVDFGLSNLTFKWEIIPNPEYMELI